MTRWHLAGAAQRWLPDRRGRDRVISLIKGRRVPPTLAAGPVSVHFGPDLTAEVLLGRDGSLDALFFAQYRSPVLVPILDAVLTGGSVFYDVGANVGLYTLWASRLVGPGGDVVAFEPVPSTADRLERLTEANGAANVEVVRAAVSSRPADVVLELIPKSSGRSRVTTVGTAHAGAPTVTSPAVTLDEIACDHRPPTLVKIDVEGHEPDVFAGMDRVLAATRPAVVFEAPDLVGSDGGSRAIVERLTDHGYEVWSLRPTGLVPFDPRSFSHNLLALHPDRHEGVRRRLRSTRFSRNQNC